MPVDERGDVNADRAAQVAAAIGIPEHSSDRRVSMRVADTWVDDPLSVLTGYAHRYGSLRSNAVRVRLRQFCRSQQLEWGF